MSSAAGAVLGPAAVHTLRWVTAVVRDRPTGRRGRARAMAAVIFAGLRIEALRGKGTAVRQGGFFNETPEGPQRRPGGRRRCAPDCPRCVRGAPKVRYVGYLFANVAVYDDIDAGLAALMLGRAEALTWRQYVLLATDT